MDLPTAESLIDSYFRRFNTTYLHTLFEEWAILGLGSSGEKLIAYHGARRESYRLQIPRDSRPLRTAMDKRKYEVGDFEFAIEAEGAGYDACIKVGDAAYLVFNHLGATMDQLRKDPQWLKVQPLWFELAQKFREDPLT